MTVSQDDTAARAIGPTIGADTVTFRVPDPLRRIGGIRLHQDVRLPGDSIGFERADDIWVLTVPRPDVDRMEYSLELEYDDGGREWVCDPGNSRRVGGAFGEKSVLEMPEYLPPAWVSTAPPPRRAPRAVAVEPWAPARHPGPAVVGRRHRRRHRPAAAGGA